ncbi:phage holin family protein, partial [Aeromonas caviae]
MPHKDPTLATALLAWLMDNWPAVYGALLALAIAFLRITYAG